MQQPSGGPTRGLADWRDKLDKRDKRQGLPGGRA